LRIHSTQGARFFPILGERGDITNNSFTTLGEKAAARGPGRRGEKGLAEGGARG